MSKYHLARRVASFLDDARRVHGDVYSYDNVVCVRSTDKVSVTCKTHGDWLVSPSNHIHAGSGCPQCNGGVAVDERTVLARARAVHGNRYSYKYFVYTGLHDRSVIECRKHGIFTQSVSDHINNGSGCSKCKGDVLRDQKQHSLDRFIKNSEKFHGKKYDYSKSVYTGAFSPITIICPKHGPFTQMANNHRRGSGCSRCSSSHGERDVRDILKDMAVKFAEQVRFPDCRASRALPFDFVVYYNGQPSLAIEVNGSQHYEQNQFFSSLAASSLPNIRARDRLKRDYCKRKGIELLVIDLRKSEPFLPQITKAFTKATGSKRWKT